MRTITLQVYGYENKTKPDAHTYMMARSIQNLKTITLEWNEALDMITKHGVIWYPAMYSGNGNTSKKNAINAAVIGLDIDDTIYDADYAVQVLSDMGYKPTAYYYTWSHTPEKPKYRIIWILNKTITPEYYERIVIYMMNALRDKGITCDSACKDISRLWNGSDKGYVLLGDEPADISIWNAAVIANVDKNKKHAGRAKIELDKIGMAAPADNAIEIKPETAHTILMNSCELYRRNYNGERLEAAERTALWAGMKNIRYNREYAVLDYLEQGMKKADALYNDGAEAHITELRKTIRYAGYYETPICTDGREWYTPSEYIRRVINEHKPIKNTAPAMSLDDAAAFLKDAIDNLDYTKATVIECPTGIGKTEMAIDMMRDSDKVIIYATPTHNNISEVMQRANAKGITVHAENKPEYNAAQLRYMRYGYSIRSGDAGDNIIRDIIADKPGNYVITHNMLIKIWYKVPADALVIIDETPAELLTNADSYTIDEIKNLREYIHSDYVGLYDKLLQEMNIAGWHTLSISYRAIWHNIDIAAMINDDKVPAKEYGRLRYDNAVIYDNKLYAFCSPIIKDENLIILSAEPKIELLRMINPNIEYIKMPMRVRNTGTIIQDLRYKAAKGTGDDNKLIEAPNIIQDSLDAAGWIKDNTPIITFKAAIPVLEKAGYTIAKDKNDRYMYYGNEKGIDALKGIDRLICYGTYNYSDEYYKQLKICYIAPNMYDDGAKPEDIAEYIANMHATLRTIAIGEYNTTAWLYDDEFMRNIQIANITEETIQAAGRSRAIRCNSDVLVISRIPISTADYYII